MTLFFSDMGTLKAKKIPMFETLSQEERGFEIEQNLVFAFLLICRSAFNAQSLLSPYFID